MSGGPRSERVAYVRVEDFGLSAVRRLAPGGDGPAVLARHGHGHAAILEVDDLARMNGIRPGMTLSQARQRAADVTVRVQDPEAEHQARDVLRHVGFGFSPHVALAPPDGLWLAVGRLAPPFMDEGHWATRLHEALLARGLPNRIGLSRHRPLALLASLAGPGVHVLVPGQEQDFAMAMPLERLPLAEESKSRLASWGLKTLGEVASLPQEALAARLGEDALALQAWLDPAAPDTPWAADPLPLARERRFRCEDDWVITCQEELHAVLLPLLEDLLAALVRDGLALQGLTLTLELDPRGEHLEHWHLPEPLVDARALLAAMMPVLERRPPPAGVTGLRLVAEEAPRPWAQGQLFAKPQPAPAAFGATLARLAGLLSPEQAGSPRPDPVRRPGQWIMTPFRRTSPAPVEDPPPPSRLALALWRPPRPITVLEAAGRPCEIRWQRHAWHVRRAAGPWPREAAWWTPDPVLRDEWDLELRHGPLVRIFRDRQAGAWFWDGNYD
ncbi:MAG: hypothetical protein VKO21_05255 [Candidatus Sericytochromatia bacterium]|nr:hypothetical protein [Candidatus Sericytochromatia bacterium]